VDRSTGAAQALHVRGSGHTYSYPGNAGDPAHAHRHFPDVNIPVVSIIWNYNGLDAQQMSDRIVSITERALTTTVDNIQHFES